MGALGPKHVVMKPEGFFRRRHIVLRQSPHIARQKRLVFVDAMGTGFSRASNLEQSKNIGM